MRTKQSSDYPRVQLWQQRKLCMIAPDLIDLGK